MSLICEIFKKNDTNELIYKTETDLTDIENKVMVTKEKWRGRDKWGTGINRCILTLLFSHYVMQNYIKNT